MEKKRFYKVIRAFKHNGEIREFLFTLPYTFDEAYALAVDSTDYSVWDLIAIAPVDPMCSIAAYIVTFEDRKDTLLCSYRVVADINELGTILICAFNVPIRQTIFSVGFTFLILLIFI